MSKKKIVTSVIILFLLIAAGCLVWRCRYFFLGTSSDPVRAKENEDFGIEDFHSSVDKDGDGIDDQTDIRVDLFIRLDQVMKPFFRQAFTSMSR